MLKIFTLAHGRLFQEAIGSLDALCALQPVWIDLESPTLQEQVKRRVNPYVHQPIAADAMDEDIGDAVRRFHEEESGGLRIHVNFLIADDKGAPVQRPLRHALRTDPGCKGYAAQALGRRLFGRHAASRAAAGATRAWVRLRHS